MFFKKDKDLLTMRLNTLSDKLIELEDNYKSAINKVYSQQKTLIDSENECRLAISKIIQILKPTKSTKKKGK